MKKNKRVISLIFLYWLSFESCFSIAFAEKNYQIDVIIFKRISKEAQSSEMWHKEISYPNLTKTAELSNLPTDEYHLLASSQVGLQKEADRLKKEGSYKIVLHQSWVQPILNHAQTKWVHLSGGRVFDHHIFEIDGKIRISQEQFFEIEPQLYFTFPSSTLPWNISLQTVQFHEIRRTRLHQLNYFDHPLLGILIEIVPYTHNK